MDTLIVRSRNLYTCTSNTFDKNMEHKLSNKKNKKNPKNNVLSLHVYVLKRS